MGPVPQASFFMSVLGGSREGMYLRVVEIKEENLFEETILSMAFLKGNFSPDPQGFCLRPGKTADRSNRGVSRKSLKYTGGKCQMFLCLRLQTVMLLG